MDNIIKAGMLLFVLLNPLLLSIYLLELMKETRLALFSHIVIRAGLISTVAFFLFARLGDFIFTVIFQVRFSSFLIFGGILFLMIGLRMMLTGSAAVVRLQGGEPRHIAGKIALPFLIGPGTISASVLIGKRVPDPVYSLVAIVSAVAASALALVMLKALYDFVQARHQALLERYLDITGRVIAMFTGTYAVEMITKGVALWLKQNGFGAPEL